MKDSKELARYFPITMSEVKLGLRDIKEVNQKKSGTLPNEDALIKDVRKRMDNIALARAERNLKLETREEILSEIKDAVRSERESVQKAEEELVKKALQGEEVDPCPEDSKLRIITELKAIYKSDLV